MKRLIAICLAALASACATTGEPCHSGSPDNCAEARRMIMQDALYYRAY